MVFTLKTEVQELKNQNELLLKQIETPAEKIKSCKDLKKELGAFFSIHGYSEILLTDNVFKKVYFLIFLTGMLCLAFYYTHINLDEYFKYDVVTQIKVIDVEKIMFPAVAFCLADETQPIPISKTNISKRIIVGCYFESLGPQNNCNDNDSTSFLLEDPYYNRDCIIFNENKSRSSTHVGHGSGLLLLLNMSKNEILYYHIGEPRNRPIFREMTNVIESKDGLRKAVTVGIKKTVDTKLPEPYNKCTNDINSETSKLVRDIWKRNISYDYKYCLELCYYNHLKENAAFRNISILQSFLEVTFDYKTHCNALCPNNCNSTTYEVTQIEKYNSDFLHFFPDIERESFKSLVFVNIFYRDRKYTDISQVVKSTRSNLLGNIGSYLALFLELSLFGVYRFSVYILEIILLKIF